MSPPVRVLVVEDERDARELLVRGLERQGFIAAGAADGREAVELLGAGWDIVVTDLVMPRLDGLQLLAEINQRCPAILRVVITSFADKDRVVAVLNLGADYLLEKPFNAERLAAVLRSLLDGKVPGQLTQFFQRRLSIMPLSPRERELVEHVLKGLGNKDIARVLGIGEQTVKNSLSVVYAKLGIASRAELFHAVFPV